MKLINTTNSHAALVKSQLASTDALLVEVYSAGNTDVVFTQAPTHYELLISNKHRAIRETEVEKIREFFLKRKIDLKVIDQSAIKTLYTDKLIEISFPITALCQLQWVDEKLQPGEDQIGSLLFDVQSNENSRFKVFKISEAKSISLDDFDEVISSLQFRV